ncbi:MAG: ROK family protein [Candidatus Accumulibacter sp.]|jgi:predicted NBD/HSP70 family sugar kinase|nr:ROK family protein [Accumulibacter sp.]
MIRLGIDLGGTKIEIIAIDSAGRELLRRRIATPQGDYAGTLRAIAALVETAENELGESGRIGIGAPGAESVPDGRIKNANSTCLNGKPLRFDLQSLLRREIRIDNDANCLALSEAVDGAGADAQVVFAAILGTGVGGGLAVRGRVLAGANRIAGEWGHNPLPRLEEEDAPPPRCYCGRQGCVETWLSGPGLAGDHARRAGETLPPQEIVARAEQGDAACEATLGHYERRLAKALATVINVVDPDVVVLGGGLSNIERLYRRVPALWAAHVFSDTVRTRLLRSLHGDSSGVRGAAWLWERAESSGGRE